MVELVKYRFPFFLLLVFCFALAVRGGYAWRISTKALGRDMISYVRQSESWTDKTSVESVSIHPHSFAFIQILLLGPRMFGLPTTAWGLWVNIVAGSLLSMTIALIFYCLFHRESEAVILGMIAGSEPELIASSVSILREPLSLLGFGCFAYGGCIGSISPTAGVCCLLAHSPAVYYWFSVAGNLFFASMASTAAYYNMFLFKLSTGYSRDVVIFHFAAIDEFDFQSFLLDWIMWLWMVCMVLLASSRRLGFPSRRFSRHHFFCPLSDAD